jgi:hypothetical protein
MSCTDLLAEVLWELSHRYVEIKKKIAQCKGDTRRRRSFASIAYSLTAPVVVKPRLVHDL